MQIAFPFQIDPHGLVASAREDAHIRDLIEQVLFTAPGERVNRPEISAARCSGWSLRRPTPSRWPRSRGSSMGRCNSGYAT